MGKRKHMHEGLWDGRKREDSFCVFCLFPLHWRDLAEERVCLRITKIPSTVNYVQSFLVEMNIPGNVRDIWIVSTLVPSCHISKHDLHNFQLKTSYSLIWLLLATDSAVVLKTKFDILHLRRRKQRKDFLCAEDTYMHSLRLAWSIYTAQVNTVF